MIEALRCAEVLAAMEAKLDENRLGEAWLFTHPSRRRSLAWEGDGIVCILGQR